MRNKMLAALISMLLVVGMWPSAAFAALAEGAIALQEQSGALTEDQTALGLFSHIRDNAPEGSAAFIDAQCAIDILTGTTTNSISYPSYQTPQQSDTTTATDGTSNADAYKAVNLTSAGDAASLENFKTSLDWIDRYNAYRANENETEGTTLSTTVGMNCRMMAISIVMCDWSKATVAHSRAFSVGENLSWGYANPFDGWYTEEKATYKALVAEGKSYPDGFSGSEQGSVGHYLNIVDYAGTGTREEYPTSVTGFATCQDGALYGVAHEQSFYTFGAWYPANIVYSTDEFRAQWFDAYYAAHAEGSEGGSEADGDGQGDNPPEPTEAPGAADDAEEPSAGASEEPSQESPQEPSGGSEEKPASVPADVSLAGASIALAGAGFTYTGSAITPAVNSVTVGGAKVPTSGYTVSYSNNVKAGTASVTVKGRNGYSGSAVRTFTIAKASAASFKVASIAAKTYNGKAQKPKPKVTFKGKKLKAGSDYTLKYSANKAAGKASIAIRGKGNFTGSKTVRFKIAKAPVAKAKVSKIPAVTYTGASFTPKPTVKVGGVQLKAGRDYRLKYANNRNAGTAKVKIVGRGNYTGSKTVSFTIGKASLSGASVAAIGAQRYTGSAIEPAPSVSLGGKNLVRGRDYTVSYSGNVNAGTAIVRVTGMGNYTGSVSTSFSISAPVVVQTAVYITNTGKKFHRSWCPSLRVSRHEISRADALARGYEPCKVCKP